MHCIFCQIIQREAPGEILYETDQVISILDVRPIHFGHALVIPKAHCTDFLSVPEHNFHDVMHAGQIVARAIVQALGLEGFNIFINTGRVAGQSVFHFHMHIVPRYPGDNLRFAPELKTYPEGSMADYAQRIRRNIHQ